MIFAYTFYQIISTITKFRNNVFECDRKIFHNTTSLIFVCIESFPVHRLWVGTRDIYCPEKRKPNRSSTYEIMIYWLKYSYLSLNYLCWVYILKLLKSRHRRESTPGFTVPTCSHSSDWKGFRVKPVACRTAAGLLHLPFTLRASVCFWKGKNRFTELSPDGSPGIAHAARAVLGTPSRSYVKQRTMETISPCSSQLCSVSSTLRLMEAQVQYAFRP